MMYKLACIAAALLVVLSCSLDQRVADQGPGPSIATGSLPDGVVGASYTFALTATGGTQPLEWSVGTGSLPPALALAGSGILSGTPTTSGSFQFEAVVTDSTGRKSARSLQATIHAGLAVTTSSLPNGSPGVAYSQTLAAAGGTTPYTWSVIAGSLPSSLTMAYSGVISGTPSVVGVFNFTVKVSDAMGGTATAALSITIYAPVSITTSSLPNGSPGVAYSQFLTAAGGVTPYVWSMSAGSLPPGLALSASTGDITGTPTNAGIFGFTARVDDAAGGAATGILSITIR